MARTPSDESRPRGSPSGAGSLLEWYDRVKRSLPWRRDRDPYRVWLSEAMLQQTRVETAIPYYERFLSAFPSVAHLARAEPDEVQALWSGLGYYRRARLLLEAARQIVEAGAFPETSEGWRRLPGVGPYTSAAVASIVHRERVLALDGNVERVVARLEAYPENPKSAAGRRFLTEAGHRWLDSNRPGDSNQALMELGATVCLTRNPRCDRCPIGTGCRARLQGKVEEYPRRAASAPRSKLRLLAVCVTNRERLLLFRRESGSGLLSGTWEVPWVDAREPDPADALGRCYGGRWRLGDRVHTIRHAITHRDLRVDVLEGSFEGSEAVAEGKSGRWSNLAELEKLPHSSLVRKIFLAVEL